MKKIFEKIDNWLFRLDDKPAAIILTVLIIVLAVSFTLTVKLL